MSAKKYLYGVIFCGVSFLPLSCAMGASVVVDENPVSRNVAGKVKKAELPDYGSYKAPEPTNFFTNGKSFRFKEDLRALLVKEKMHDPKKKLDYTQLLLQILSMFVPDVPLELSHKGATDDELALFMETVLKAYKTNENATEGFARTKLGKYVTAYMDPQKYRSNHVIEAQDTSREAKHRAHLYVMIQCLKTVAQTNNTDLSAGKARFTNTGPDNFPEDKYPGFAEKMGNFIDRMQRILDDPNNAFWIKGYSW